jgi:hypothetical protein
MIEINLVPDVKRELLRAQKIRSNVIYIAIIIGIAAASIVVLLGIWVFIVQTTRGALSDNTIKKEHQKLVNVADLSHTLTIQNQLKLLSNMQSSKHVTSRIFDVLTTINPPTPNDIAINKITLDAANSTIIAEAQAANGYPALEVFRKTIAATSFTYTQDGNASSVPLATDISDSDRSYGEDTSGKKVLRFTLSFKYPEELFSPTVKNASIIAPTKKNATDSYLGVPQSLFTEKATDTVEEK